MCLIVIGFAVTFADTKPYRMIQLLLERPWRVERYVYRHHRRVGSAIIVGALLLLGVLGVKHARLFGAGYPDGSGARAAEFLVLAMSLAVLVIGFIVRIRPSALKRVEVLANRSIQLSPAKIHTHRPFGILLLLAGIIFLAVASRVPSG
jgi:hypothetical protein